MSRFEEAGYADDYASEHAEAWNTDSRTAKIVGALVIDAGCCVLLDAEPPALVPPAVGAPQLEP